MTKIFGFKTGVQVLLKTEVEKTTGREDLSGIVKVVLNTVSLRCLLDFKRICQVNLGHKCLNNREKV